MSEAIVRIENLSKRYRLGSSPARYKTLREALVKAVNRPRKNPDDSANEWIWALRNVSFQIEQGEVLGVIGRNGAGKSTLLKILARITRPTEGRVRLRGRVGSLLEVGTGFHPELSGRENIYLNGAILGMGRDEIGRKFDEIVTFAEIERFLDTPVKHYSSGMYTRLAFSVAAHLEPEILLVDEVLAVGDVAFQKKCLGKMGRVAQEGRTVIFVSHNMAAVRSLCTSALRLEAGEVASTGSVEQVIAEYLAASTTEALAELSLPRASSEQGGSGLTLRFTDLNGKRQSQFRLGEPWRIELEFEMYRPMPSVIAGVGVGNLDNVPIITYWSQPADLNVGKYRAAFECQVPLKATSLQFYVGLSSFERNFYYLNGIGHVAISEVAVGQQPFRASGSGILLSIQEVEIEPLEIMM